MHERDDALLGEFLAECREHLADIDKNTTGRCDLSVGVVAFVSGFGIHWVAADHAGLSRCWRIAFAASAARSASSTP
jgi:hypothetical protein